VLLIKIQIVIVASKKGFYSIFNSKGLNDRWVAYPRMDEWLGFNGILSTQVAAISCLRKFKVC